ncbi:MAG: hypothetical protein GH148_02490 [Clostridia bacterium]|nr:hypothetical protein [Clostridia bacterium]
MAGINSVKLKILEETISFYKVELKKGELTEKERDKYFGALKSIKKIIKEKEDCRERGKHKIFISPDHKKAISLNKRGY